MVAAKEAPPRTGLAWLFPVGAFALLPIAFFVGYGIGVMRNDIEEVWPYVSDTGASPPESCIFGQLVNMSASLMVVSLYLRHRHIMAFYRSTKHKRAGIILSSRIFLAVGMFAAFGMMLVANFQEQQVDVSLVHFIGAGIAFILGLVYGWYQTLLSFLTPRKFTPRWLAVVRLVICAVGTICLVGVFAFPIDKDKHPPPTDLTTVAGRPLHYYRGPNDPGYAAFLTTTICEWILAFCLALFFLTLAFDLKSAGNVHPPRLSLYVVDKDNLDLFGALESDVQPRPIVVTTPTDDVVVEVVDYSSPPIGHVRSNQRTTRIHIDEGPSSSPQGLPNLTTDESIEEPSVDAPRHFRHGGIPLTGLTNDPATEQRYWMSYADKSKMDDDGASEIDVSQGASTPTGGRRPRGLRRTYENDGQEQQQTPLDESEASRHF